MEPVSSNPSPAASSVPPRPTGPGVRAPWLPRRHVALGIGEAATPSFVFVAAGAVLGPEVLDVLSGNVLAQLDPVVSLALAVLGVFVGAGYVRAMSGNDKRWVMSAAAEASVTLACVAGGMYFLLTQWTPSLPVGAATAATVLGLCAAASAALQVDAATPPSVASAARMADFDDIPLVIAGAIAVPLLAGVAQPALTVVLAAVAGLTIAFAGTLLFERANGAPERLVFVTGTVVLLGGAASYASASPLATGFIAGLLWTWAPSSTVPLVESDLRKLQHPLVALLLVIAGASIQFTDRLLWLAAPLVLSRLAGKLLGSLITARPLGLSPGLIATVLVPPGVLGIALALNVQQVIGTGDTIIVSTVTVAVVASELLAALLLPGEDAS